MKYISLGSACYIKQNLKKSNKDPLESFFFDWFITSFQTVIDVLSTKDVEKLFAKKYFIDDSKSDIRPKEERKHIKLKLSSVDNLVSIHDIKNINEYKDFASKYIRRFDRMIKLICSNEKIIFIRGGVMPWLKSIATPEQINLFFDIVKSINPDCDFLFAQLIINSDKNEVVKSKNFIEIKTTGNKDDKNWCPQRIIVDPSLSTLSPKLNWNYFFKTIENEL